jgi:hypothetical protein
MPVLSSVNSFLFPPFFIATPDPFRMPQEKAREIFSRQDYHDSSSNKSLIKALSQNVETGCPLQQADWIFVTLPSQSEPHPSTRQKLPLPHNRTVSEGSFDRLNAPSTRWAVMAITAGSGNLHQNTFIFD